MTLADIKISFRSLIAQKSTLLINIIGLAVGLASALIISLYVVDEFSYDRFHPNAKNIYRICLDAKLHDTELQGPITNVAIGPVSYENYPDILNFVRVFSFAGEPVIRYENNSFVEKKLIYADSTFFQVFNGFRLIQGDAQSILNKPYQMVMTISTAQRYFGNEDPVGKTVQYGQGRSNWEVVGVVDDISFNSHIDFDIICSFVTLPASKSTSWGDNNYYSYLLLQEDLDPKEVDKRFAQLALTHAGPMFEELMGISFQELEAQGNRYRYFTQPMLDIHLKSNMPYETHKGGNIVMVYVFVLIAIFILSIAVFNFMNLSTARFAKRAKEVGIKKVLGSPRLALIKQFLTESVLLTAFSLLVAIVLILSFLPNFNAIAGKEINLSSLPLPLNFCILILTAIFVGVVAGSYPAFFLSKFNPISVLKGKIQSGMRGRSFRGTLVVLQFSITIGLIISSTIVYKQTSYVQKKDLGFSPLNLLVINRPYAIPLNQRTTFDDEIRELPFVDAVSRSSSLPTIMMGNTMMQKEGASKEDFQAYNFFFAHYDLDKTLQLRIAQGRYFSKDFASDSSAVLLNQAAAKGFGFLESPLGEKIVINQNDVRTIVGVIEDYHYESLHQNISPLVIVFRHDYNYLAIRLQDEIDTPSAIQVIEEKWKSFVPDQPFDFFFMDDAINKMYSDENRAKILFSGFSILAIIIALLGLLGLSLYSAEQRTREIGIRKVFGSSVGQIIWLLLAEVNRLIIIATLISWPIAWYFMGLWLENFAFRINISYWVFLGSSAFAYIIALLTVGYQAYRVANVNPAITLKYE